MTDFNVQQENDKLEEEVNAEEHDTEKLKIPTSKKKNRVHGDVSITFSSVSELPAQNCVPVLNIIICVLQYLFILQRNEYVQNTNAFSEEENKAYNYYICPYIPFWTDEKLTFQEVNEYVETVLQREDKYPRFLLEKLTRTWSSVHPIDKMWFDNKDVYKYYENSLINRILSKNASKKHTKIRKQYFYNQHLFF